MFTAPIRTARLVLTPLTAADRDAFVAYRRAPEVARWQSWTTEYSEDDADRLLGAQPVALVPGSGRWLQIAVRDGAARRLLGDVGVHALAAHPDTFELGVTVAPACQRAGIGSEALRAVIDHLFATPSTRRLVAHSDARNLVVGRLLGRLGFRFQGRAVDLEWCKGEWVSIDSWEMRAEECRRTDRTQ